LPSDPGAPLGHSSTTCGSAAAQQIAHVIHIAKHERRIPLRYNGLVLA